MNPDQCPKQVRSFRAFTRRIAQTVDEKKPAHFLVQAVWFGLVVGFLEVAIWLLQKTFVDPFSYLSRDMVWMAPLAGVVVFIFPGMIVTVLALVSNFRSLQFFGSLFFAFLAACSLLFLTYKLHPVTALPLALGIAYQLALAIRRRSEGYWRVVFRSTGWMFISLFALLTAAQSWQVVKERTALAHLPPGSTSSPNVLLIVLDTVRAESLSLHGYGRKTTPNLESLAKEGTQFASAISTSPWTLPSHSSIFTGRYPHELSAGWYAPLDQTHPTLAEALGGAGYATAGFAANTPYCNWETGLDRGFSYYEDYSISAGEVLRSSSLVRRSMIQFFGLRRLFGQFDNLGRKRAPEISQSFLDWLDRRSDRPFFAFLNYFDAHDPYLPPPPFDAEGPLTIEEYRLACRWWFMDKKNVTPREIEEAKNAYESCISYLDSELGVLFRELRQRQILENTVVVITSDHGELFGEHGLFGHGNCLYRPSVHVPLIISYPPRVPVGQKIEEPVTLRDIPSTILELVELPGARSLPGTPLTRFWDASKQEQEDDFILSEIALPSRVPPDHGRSPVAGGAMQAVLDDGKWYIKNHGTGFEELYDFEADHFERANLVNDPASSKTLQKMRQTLAAVNQDR